ncbi:Conserved_hypothetical protein [Hexamita inflata]|uniref:Uncharacterized protein n=1 Tax=Hexamita inflata TaxID=28002 RepID=A0AA86U9P3_9EUKA|nr:Conserved hypothetical protein [Hexamita inflata]
MKNQFQSQLERKRAYEEYVLKNTVAIKDIPPQVPRKTNNVQISNSNSKPVSLHNSQTNAGDLVQLSIAPVQINESVQTNLTRSQLLQQTRSSQQHAQQTKTYQASLNAAADFLAQQMSSKLQHKSVNNISKVSQLCGELIADFAHDRNTGKKVPEQKYEIVNEPIVKPEIEPEPVQIEPETVQKEEIIEDIVQFTNGEAQTEPEKVTESKHASAQISQIYRKCTSCDTIITILDFEDQSRTQCDACSGRIVEQPIILHIQRCRICSCPIDQDRDYCDGCSQNEPVKVVRVQQVHNEAQTNKFWNISDDIMNGNAAMRLLESSIINVKKGCNCGKDYMCTCGCDFPLHDHHCHCDQCMIRPVHEHFEKSFDVNVYKNKLANGKVINKLQSVQAEVDDLLKEFPFLKQHKLTVDDYAQDETIMQVTRQQSKQPNYINESLFDNFEDQEKQIRSTRRLDYSMGREHLKKQKPLEATIIPAE